VSDVASYHFPLFLIMQAGYLLGVVIPLASMSFRRREIAGKNIGLAASLGSSIAGLLLALSVLVEGGPFHLAVHGHLPLGEILIHCDHLSAFFLGVISLLGMAVAVYSFSYVSTYQGRRNIGILVALYNLFLFAMSNVVIAGDAIFFLLLWELMSLATFFLINYEHDDPASRRAAFLYVVMTHVGTAFLVAMFLILQPSGGGFGFEALRWGAAHLSPGMRSVVFLCALVGFGTKAGIIPLHIWLPEAHPAAPSNVSALMSGVMIKTGIYGMVRVFFDFMGPDIPHWWGMLLLMLAVVSAVLGVLYALMEHDLKRLLAYHSIENIGIILIGVGGALLFSSFGLRSLAAVALIAGLYHVLNHAIFKGLLFLGAGSVVHATSTRNIDELGGLIRKLPWTSFFFLVGAVAISALPPLNGFVSEWLTLQSLLLGFHISDIGVRIAVPLAVALLALTSALAAACFVKAFGITFLGLPRSAFAEGAHESPRSMLFAMGFLAVLCLFFGVLPGQVIALLDPLAASLVGESGVAPLITVGGVLTVGQSVSSSIAPGILGMLLAVLVVVPVLAGLLLAGRLHQRTSMTWACGMPKIEPRMQYTATGFSKPLRMIFSNIFRATHEIRISEEISPYFHPKISYELKTESVFLKYLYEPVYAFILGSAKVMRRVQTGRIQTYLAYIFITLVLLLLFAR
jgi:hydrogenase-4 component B